MQKPQIVAYFFVPADQHAPEAIHPAMRAFHRPAPGFEPSLLSECLGLFPPRPDVGGEAKLVQECSNLVIVITL
jgi:hypothetical protein